MARYLQGIEGTECLNMKQTLSHRVQAKQKISLNKLQSLTNVLAGFYTQGPGVSR